MVLHKKVCTNYHRSYSLVKQLAEEKEELADIDIKPLILAATDIHTDASVSICFLFVGCCCMHLI